MTKIYESKEFNNLKNLDALSEEAIKLHKQLYDGYVKKINEVNEKLESVDLASANHNYSTHRGLLLDRSHNLNGVVLHELFFSNLTSEKTEPSEEFKSAVLKDFKTWEAFIDNLKAAAMSSRAGWAMTVYNYRDGEIQNFLIDQHDLHMPIYIKPLLLLDVWEHAFVTDYGTNKKAYVEKIVENLNWTEVSHRFETIKHGKCNCKNSD